MEEDIISFKLAKLSKEKLFSVGGYFSYVQYHEEYIYDDSPEHPESYLKGEIRYHDGHYHKNLEKFCDFSNEYFTTYEAPTHSMLQKWLRIEHNIVVIVNAALVESGNSHGIRYTWYIVKPDLTTIEDKSLLGYLTFEEAMEIALEKGLKLIKIKKNK